MIVLYRLKPSESAAFNTLRSAISCLDDQQADIKILLYDNTPGGQDVGAISHLKQAFSSEDGRTIQKPFLVDGFLESPVFGSGFGAAAVYVRDNERPWAGYELTYYQMLFNLGTVGVLFLGALFSFYFGMVVRLIRKFKKGATVPFALLVAYCSFFVGAYSNPYFGSFDLLFFVGLLPFLSTFQSGFDQFEPKVGVAL